MKKRSVLILILMLSIFTTTVYAENVCKATATLLNQDPYPAVPGDYVKLVFQVDGLDNPSCGDITFNLLPDYPIQFNPGESGLKTFKKVDYIKDYKTSILIPYKVRVNEDALDGISPIKAMIQNKGDVSISKTFNLKIKDVRTDFGVYIKDYDYTTDIMTLEILNIGKPNIEALTVEIPQQKNIEVKGSNKNIVGDLDSNEYTTADFEAKPKDGNITIKLTYSDEINVRRTIEKTISFNSTYFKNRKSDEPNRGIGTYLIWIAVLGLLGYFGWKKFKKKNK